jgi:hypothetical protein
LWAAWERTCGEEQRAFGASSITVELNPSSLKTGGDGYLKPAVMEALE